MAKESKWEQITESSMDDNTEETHRLAVPGGWLYRVRSAAGAGRMKTRCESVVFVPDPGGKVTAASARPVRAQPAPKPASVEVRTEVAK
jgi:hypothetical protein